MFLSSFSPVTQVYDTATGCWVETVAMLSKRCRLGVATLNGKIYACGGYDGSSFLRSVECFDPVTNKWVCFLVTYPTVHGLLDSNSVADPGSGAFLTPGYGSRDE
jgi:hypothetical protein